MSPVPTDMPSMTHRLTYGRLGGLVGDGAAPDRPSSLGSKDPYLRDINSAPVLARVTRPGLEALNLEPVPGCLVDMLGWQDGRLWEPDS
jgi:hypothetical protein